MIQVSPDDLTPVGHDLKRPESVLATAAGDLFIGNERGGVSRLHADGWTGLPDGRGRPAAAPLTDRDRAVLDRIAGFENGSDPAFVALRTARRTAGGRKPPA